MNIIYADKTASISELKKSPSNVIKSAYGEPVAILNHNKPEAYLIPAEAYEKLLDLLEDIELAEIVRERRNEKSIKVNLNDL